MARRPWADRQFQVAGGGIPLPAQQPALRAEQQELHRCSHPAPVAEVTAPCASLPVGHHQVQVGAIPGEAPCQRDHFLRSGEHNASVPITEAKHGTFEAADAADDEAAELRIVLGHGFECPA